MVSKSKADEHSVKDGDTFLIYATETSVNGCSAPDSVCRTRISCKLDENTGEYLADPLPSVDLPTFLEHERYAYGRYGLMVRPTLQQQTGYCGLDFYSACTRSGDNGQLTSTESTSRNDPISESV